MDKDSDILAALGLLRRSLAAGRLGHAYLVDGPARGAGGRLAERAVALLYCTGPEPRPCGSCRNCRRVALRSHPDVFWIEPQKKSRGILMEQVDAAQDHLALSAMEGGWKVVVFLDSDRFNVYAANHFLKLLEEPPPRCLLLLVTERPSALPPTIVSRCQRIVLPGGADAEHPGLRDPVTAAMAGEGLGSGAAGAAARAGILLDALKQQRASIETAVAAEIGGAGVETDFAAGKEVQEARLEGLYKEAVAGLLRWLLLWQRDLLAATLGIGGRAAPAFPEQADAIGRQAAGLTCRQVLDNIRTVEAMRWQIERNLPVPMVLERGLIRLTAGPSRRASRPEPC